MKYWLAYLKFPLYLCYRAYGAGFWGFVTFLCILISPILVLTKMIRLEYQWYMALVKRNER